MAHRYAVLTTVMAMVVVAVVLSLTLVMGGRIVGPVRRDRRPGASQRHGERRRECRGDACNALHIASLRVTRAVRGCVLRALVMRRYGRPGRRVQPRRGFSTSSISAISKATGSLSRRLRTMTTTAWLPSSQVHGISAVGLEPYFGGVRTPTLTMPSFGQAWTAT
jgi:hypothetical protein